MDVTLVVDALNGQLSGIGRYVRELARRVPQEPGVGRARFFASGGFVRNPESLLQGVQPAPRLRLPRSIEQALMRHRLRSSLVHGPNYFLPEEAQAGVITCHDLSVFRYPETHPAERVEAFEREFGSSLERAAHVITDSETVRAEVIADFGVAKDKITAIPLGVGRGYRPRTIAELQPALHPLGLTANGYGLCVSTLEPRKKITELLRAWHQLPEPLRTSTPLVLAGASGWLNEQLHEDIRAGAAAGWLKPLGFVSEAVLEALYAGASLFLYPSIYEGFGLPPVEAMASGVPALVANRSCLPEVCGDAAGYVEPDDTEGFSGVIAEALTDSKWRKQAKAMGLERSARFTWERCASATVEVYRSICP